MKRLSSAFVHVTSCPLLQLALFQEPEKKAAPTAAPDRFVFSKLARFFDWHSALIIVKPATLIGCRRASFRRFWRWKSRSVGRPRVKAELRRLIWRAAENPTWDEERIADELLLKLQIRLSPPTWANTSNAKPRPLAAARISAGPLSSEIMRMSLSLATSLLRLRHTSFRILYIFVALEIGSRRLVHFNVIEHPTGYIPMIVEPAHSNCFPC
jgi:putative transposase